MKTITRLSRWRASFGVEAFRSMPSFLGLELVASSLLLRLRLPSSPLEVGVVVPLSLTLPATSLMRLWCCTAPPTTRQQTKAKLINVSGFLFCFDFIGKFVSSTRRRVISPPPDKELTSLASKTFPFFSYSIYSCWMIDCLQSCWLTESQVNLRDVVVLCIFNQIAFVSASCFAATMSFQLHWTT